MDSRFSHHMTGRKDLLKDIQPTCHYAIHLPNGAEAIDIEQRSAYLGPNFTVHNVLL